MSDRKHHPVFPVQPGPCPIIDGVPVCPPPTEIDIIKVKKVFQECMHTQVEEVEGIEFEVPVATNDLTAQCVSAAALNVECEIVSPGMVRVSFDLEVCTRLVNTQGQQVGEVVCELVEGIVKVLSIPRAGEAGLDCQAHVYPECLLCFIADLETNEEETVVSVTCCVGILVLIKLEAEVQLLVPTYGYAPPPPECAVLGECPDDYVPDWPPYPPQKRPPIGNPVNTGNSGKPGCHPCK